MAYAKHLLRAVGEVYLPSCIMVPQCVWGLVPGSPMDTKIQGCLRPLYQMVLVICI